METENSPSYFKVKKNVTFDETRNTCIVMYAWRFAYNDARKGPWEQYVRDRERFNIRIKKTEPILTEILMPKHREKKFQQMKYNNS